jgi:phosphopentomutase
MSRALLCILDSAGIGGAPDAEAYGNKGANTLGHIAALRPMHLPNLSKLGLGHAMQAATGEAPRGFDLDIQPIGQWGYAVETSKGKDTPSGHWEIAGVPVTFEWGYFPQTIPCFPKELTDAMIAQAKLPGILGNKHASGTAIIEEFGVEHMRTAKPIVYTSADSVLQIAAHEESFGLDNLYRLCKIAFPLVAPFRIGRVIARPFTGTSPANFERTGNRRDYSVKPPGKTLLDIASEHGREVISVGKIGDIFANEGTGEIVKATGNAALMDATLKSFARLKDGGLLVVNFVDFDQLYGHRRDVEGYAMALEDFDARLPELLALLKHDDLILITADHGNDPTWAGSDHTRECVPILAYSPSLPGKNIGRRETFSDMGQSIAAWLGLGELGNGRGWL